MASSSDEEPEKQAARTHSVSRLFQIALAFTTVFFLLVLIATLLCLFVTLPLWTIQNPPETNANLPIRLLTESVFLTKIFSNKVTLASSFASNIAQFAASPFLLLFSFLVALELANRHEAMDQDTPKVLQGDQKFLFNWIVLWLRRAPNTTRAKGTRIAGVGALISLTLTVLLLAGDKLLQGTIGPKIQRVYDENYTDFYFNYGSFMINETICLPEEPIPDIYHDNVAPPCSIDNTTNPWTLQQASTAYRVLATGLLNQTSDFHKEDFKALWNASDSGTFDFMQLVTYIEPAPGNQHVFFFNPMLAEEDNKGREHRKLDLVNDDLERVGLDYIANTVSVTTRCSPITVDCGMQTTEGNNTSVPYHCSDIMNGDLTEIPANGLERLKGWNTTFFNLDNGSPRKISVASQLNPFSYNVTAVVDSINIEGLINFRDPQALQGNIIGVGNGRVAFALSCTSTVHDVTYSLVDGNIYAFNKTLAAPSTAAIVKAPLQAGFGSYVLFEKAAMSVLFNNLTVMDSMELAFSQTFLALAAGVYAHAPNVKQRWRGDMTLTALGKGPFYFLVVCMFLYALVVLVSTVIALSLFGRSDVLEVQARLISKD